MTSDKRNAGVRTLRKTIVPWGGRAALFLSLIFLSLEVRQHWGSFAHWNPGIEEVLFIFSLSLVYAIALGLLVESWHWIVAIFGKLSRAQTYPSFALTQIAKYLPGNVAHLLGRGLYLRGGSLSDSQIVKATVTEVVSVLFGASLCILAAGSIGKLPPPISHVPEPLWQIGLCLCLGGLLLSLELLIWKKRLNAQQARSFLITVSLATVFMAVLGGIFAAVYNLIEAGPPVLLASAAILAWMVGYLTPGAPGGLGTREAAFVLFLSALDENGSVLIAAAIFRVVTTLADGWLFVCGWLVFHRPNHTRPSSPK